MKLKAAVLSGIVAAAISGTAMADDACYKERDLLWEAVELRNKGINSLAKCSTSLLRLLGGGTERGSLTFTFQEVNTAVHACSSENERRNKLNKAVRKNNAALLKLRRERRR